MERMEVRRAPKLNRARRETFYQPQAGPCEDRPDSQVDESLL